MKLDKLIRSLLLGALGVLALEGVSLAQVANGFVVNKFEPAERGSDWFTLDSLDLRGHTRPAVGATFQYNYAPLVARDTDGNTVARIVQHQVIAHVGASMTFGDRVRLGLDLPFYLYSDGNQGKEAGRTWSGPANAQSVGDVRIGFDFRLFGKYGDAFTTAIGAQMAMPTGTRENYNGEGSPRFQPHIAFAGDVGVLAYAARIGYMSRSLSSSDTWSGGTIGSEVNVAVALGIRAMERKLLIGPEFFASTVIDDKTSFFGKATTPAEVLLGAHYYMPNGLRVGGGAGPGLTSAMGSPDVRVLLSIEWAAPYKEEVPEVVVVDKDGDGIVDLEDACPTVAGVHTSDPKTNGCPVVKPKDKDGDGIIDDVDACPEVPGVPNDDPKKNGCPSDKDNDGIVDTADACIDVPGVASDDPKKNGCPPDKDGDGIADAEDACVDVPGVKSQNPKFNGCPADKDGDGVLNDVDACPDEPGKADADPAKNGCPMAFVQAGQIKILDQVKFKTASADILPGKDSEEVLQAVLAVMKAHPEIKKVRIEGHTDDKGSAAINKPLSANRAGSVVKWLVAHGIEASRLSSQGFGPDRPLVPNKDEESRRQNRRVEFHIDEMGTAPAPGTAATTTTTTSSTTTTPPKPATTTTPPKPATTTTTTTTTTTPTPKPTATATTPAPKPTTTATTPAPKPSAAPAPKPSATGSAPKTPPHL